jgi:GH24 family phage-related lysozyme (muramidase)
MAASPTAVQIMDALDHIRAVYNAAPPPSAADKAALEQQYNLLSDALDDAVLADYTAAADAVAKAAASLGSIPNTGLAQASAQAALASIAAQKSAAASPVPAAAPAAAPPVAGQGQMNAAGFALLRLWEGCVLNAYDDADPAHPPVQPGAPVRGTLTIAYGHTGKSVVRGLTCTQQQAEAWLQSDIAAVATTIAPMIKVQVSDNQFSAFVCFAFNVGNGCFANGSPLAYANAGNLAGVPARLALYNKVRQNGVLVPSTGLTRRRAAEIALWLTP